MPLAMIKFPGFPIECVYADCINCQISVGCFYYSVFGERFPIRNGSCERNVNIK